jgi:hypothetical protein
MENQEGLNQAERFVYAVCRKSFLALWSYVNPQAKSGRELCDILIVCEPDIIIFSVKDVNLTNSGDAQVDWNRWHKRAVEASCSQIYGAEKWVRVAPNVIRKDGTAGLPLPKETNRRIHRVAVAIGGKGEVPFQFGDFGKGFVHVFDELSFGIILQELDTISDFVDYLTAKEELYNSGINTVFEGSEENLLALYLHNGRSFPKDHNIILVGKDLWTDIVDRNEYKAKKISDRESYVWDRLIGVLCDDPLHRDFEFGPSLTEAEFAIRTMARENRFSRRILGKSYREFMELAQQKQVRSRIVQGFNQVTYVFLAVPHGLDSQSRISELGLRCFIARGLIKDNSIVVGISTEEFKAGVGSSTYLAYVHLAAWTEKDQRDLEGMQRDLDYFTSPHLKNVHEDEYPVN